MLIDGQDVTAIDKELKFSYIEVNTRLCKLIPQKVWDSQPAQRMDLYHRIDLAKPSSLMMKQLLLEILDEVNTKHSLDKNAMQYVWTLDGTRVKSLMEVHQSCRVLVVSASKTFEGLRGLDNLSGFSAMQDEASRKVKPKPGTWI